MVYQKGVGYLSEQTEADTFYIYKTIKKTPIQQENKARVNN